MTASLEDSQCILLRRFSMAFRGPPGACARQRSNSGFSSDVSAENKWVLRNGSRSDRPRVHANCRLRAAAICGLSTCRMTTRRSATTNSSHSERAGSRHTPSAQNVVAAAEGGPYTCPCCGHTTLEERGGHDICRECNWQDDGQDDHDSHIVRRRPERAVESGCGSRGVCGAGRNPNATPASHRADVGTSDHP